jgi:glycosyltransferase involved in cell wall biosynthesis
MQPVPSSTIKKLTVIIPCYNEEQYVEKVLQRLMEVNLDHTLQKEIIIVNDGSLDETQLKIEKFISQHPLADISLLNHEINKAKGSCIKTALKIATGQMVVIQDADLEYDPQDFNLLLRPFLENGADVVLGSRFLGTKMRKGPFILHALVNKVYTFISNLLTRQKLTDIHTCYKMFRTDILQNILIEEQRFGVDPELIAKLSHQKDIRIEEVGISYKGRTFAEGKKINIKDGFRAFYCIIKYNLFYKK